MNTITIEKKWSGENLTNRTGGDGPELVLKTTVNLLIGESLSEPTLIVVYMYVCM